MSDIFVDTGFDESKIEFCIEIRSDFEVSVGEDIMKSFYAESIENRLWPFELYIQKYWNGILGE